MNGKSKEGRPIKPRRAIRVKTMREARWARGLSFGALAHILGVSRSTCSDWEHGVARPSDEDGAALAKALNITEDKLWK